MSNPKVPPAISAVYRAAAIIYKNGPQSMSDLFQMINFGGKGSRADKIEVAICNGWLVITGGRIGITEFARAHFDAKPEAPAVKYAGQVATTREPYAFDAPPLSKRHIPIATGSRDDVPAYSVRVHPSFKSVAGCKS